MAKKIKLRISFNSPVILSYCILCTVILILDKSFKSWNLIAKFFTVPGNFKSAEPFNFKSVLDYIRLFTHIFGHTDWNHLAGNLIYILLIGPLLEERYGSAMICLMIFVTAFVTGVLNVCLIPSSLLGASGVAFMLIILSSFTSISKNEIPLSFILIFIIYLGSEIFLSDKKSNVSILAHIAGGLCGSMFGFLVAPKAKNVRETSKQKSKSFQDINSVDDIKGEKSKTWKTQKSQRQKNNVSKESEEEIVLGTIEL